MRPRDYRLFNAELAFLTSLPGVEAHLEPTYVELPLLAELFGMLHQWPDFGKWRWLICSSLLEDPPLKAPIDADTALIWISNENGLLPDFGQAAGAIFTPYLAQWPPPANVQVIPLGGNGDLPQVDWVPWDERKLDVFFSGQVHPVRGKFIFEAIQLLFDLQPFDFQAQIQLTPRFRCGMDPADFARQLMNSRIALIPPGTAPITLRLFEAMRSGCIIVSLKQQPYPFLQNLPQLQVPLDWEGLSEQVIGLLQDPERMLEMHAATQRHYLAHCSPQATVRMIKERLRAAGHEPRAWQTQT